MSDPFISKLLDVLVALVNDEVAMLWGVKGEIKRLQQRLGTINAVLVDAENRRIQNKAIDDWLKNLKDVMYDADDILDECQIETEKSKAAVSSRSQPCSCLFYCPCFGKTVFAHQIGRRIKGLNHRLDDILQDSSRFNLQPFSADRGDHRSTSLFGRQTSPVAELDIVGSNIQKDTDKLVELLINEDSRENILVHAIVGTGGIGKTTLARKIFNDERITTKFLMTLWVCVSKDFEETSLLKEIITQAKGNPGGASSRAQLEPKVRNAVANEKFLLVLDDVWDPKVWNDLLRNPLQSAATGSRVLVTTRSHGVASRMKAVRPHHQVELLTAEDGWVLLCKKVALSGEEGEIEDLEDIGKEIVQKCGGLPLAIKTIGGVLSTKSGTKTEWERVLRTLSSNPWSSSTHFSQEVQPALWLSYEDLPSHLKQCFLYCSLFPEDYIFNRVALIYYWISEGFIHEEGDLTLEELGEDYYGELVQRSFLQPGPDNFSNCTVHDILWSLARFLAFRLRVLKFSNSLIKKLPDSLENLIHLRYLDLSFSDISALPESIGNLVNLQFLILGGANLRSLPKGIGKLQNLRFLLLVESELAKLPSLGKLPNLNSFYIVGARAIKKIGTEFLGQEPDCSSDQGGRMQIFPKLTKLIFAEMPDWEEWEWEVKDDDRLTTVPKLKKLALHDCPKLRSLPSGLVHHATTLTKLQIVSCDSLKAIRGFSSIQELKIADSPNLEVVSDLPSLKTLKLKDHDMRALPEWLTDFPTLNKLEIEADEQLLRRCLNDGLDWPKIEHIPYVYAKSSYRSRYISKSPSGFSTNLNDYVEDHE
ncbi:putative disease resistance protein RGA3 [Phoenix dactylifera]|uniref:Disease resistance protein RGA3 n=1 Tax=Phoenix dactylifera TaxID=42345 RepID=A0A8B8ZCF4_PHODC|nr:putative disease resistance protein RGA3 [Phoenix dactylifera]